MHARTQAHARTHTHTHTHTHTPDGLSASSCRDSQVGCLTMRGATTRINSAWQICPHAIPSGAPTKPSTFGCERKNAVGIATQMLEKSETIIDGRGMRCETKHGNTERVTQGVTAGHIEKQDEPATPGTRSDC